MAFNTAEGRAEYSATSGQTLFTFNFKIYKTSDIEVYLTPAGTTPDDTTDILTETTDYTVSIDGDNGGSVTLVTPATLNDAVTFVRELPNTRDTEYQALGDLYANTLNMDQDYQTYLSADQAVRLGRNVYIPKSAQNISTELPTPEALKILRWNSTNTGLENASIGNNDVFINIKNEDSIAKMLLIDPNIYSTVNVRGYYTPNDGGGGIFNYDATQSAVNNGGTIINGWVRQYYGDIDIRWFGAVAGNNIHSAFTLAISASVSGDTISLYGKVFWMDDTLIVNKAITIKNGTLLSTGNNQVLDVTSSNVTLENIIFDFNNSSNYPYGVGVSSGAHDVLFDTCTFENMVGTQVSSTQQYALQIDAENVLGVLIDRCKFKNISQEGNGVEGVGAGFCGGISIVSTADLIVASAVTVTNSRFEDIFTYVTSGILDDDADAIRIYTPSITSTVEDLSLIVENCTFINVQKSAVKSSKGKTTIRGCKVVNNRTDTTQYSAFRSNGTTGFRVFDCEAFGNFRRGVYVGGGSNVEIKSFSYITLVADDGAIIIGDVGTDAVLKTQISDIYIGNTTRAIYLNNATDIVVDSVRVTTGIAIVINKCTNAKVSNITILDGEVLEINGSATYTVDNITFLGCKNISKTSSNTYTVNIKGATNIYMNDCDFINDSLPCITLQDNGVVSGDMYFNNIIIRKDLFSDTAAVYKGLFLANHSTTAFGKISISNMKVICDAAIPGTPAGSIALSLVGIESNDLTIDNCEIFYNQATRGGLGYSIFTTGDRALLNNINLLSSGASLYGARVDSTIVDWKGGFTGYVAGITNNSITGVFDGLTVQTGFTFSIAPTHQRLITI